MAAQGRFSPFFCGGGIVADALKKKYEARIVVMAFAVGLVVGVIFGHFVGFGG